MARWASGIFQFESFKQLYDEGPCNLNTRTKQQRELKFIFVVIKSKNCTYYIITQRVKWYIIVKNKIQFVFSKEITHIFIDEKSGNFKIT